MADRDAAEIVREQTERLRRMSYAELLEEVDAGAEHITLPRELGPDLMLEYDIMWDAGERADGNIRVIVDVWVPATSKGLASDDFIRAPDGTFIDE